MNTANTSALEIRWLIRRDMPAVMSIERASFADPWTEEEFLLHLRQRTCIAMVAERDGRVVGFMVYELHKRFLKLLNCAVAVEAQSQGVGAALMRRLADKLGARRREIVVEVNETNLDAQLFFKAVGFRATKVLRDHFDTGGDAYRMVYERDQPSRCSECGSYLGHDVDCGGDAS